MSELVIYSMMSDTKEKENTRTNAAVANNNKEADAFLSKLSVLSNDRERIRQQAKEIGKAADQIDKYIEMLRDMGLNYTADSMARNTAEIKQCQESIQQIVKQMHRQEQEQEQ